MKILFISNSRLGDAILTTGVLKHLVNEHGHASITIVTGKVAAPIFEAIPNVTKIISLEKQKFGLHWFHLWREASKTKWDIIVDFRRSLISHFLSGNEKYCKTKKEFRDSHAAKRNASILNLKKAPFPYIWLDATHQNNANRILKNKDDVSYITIAPTANWPCKMWPMENFVKLTMLIKQLPKFSNAKFIVTAAPQEYESCKLLLDYLKEDAISLIKGCDLLTVAACIKQSKLFIGNDSGLMHLAAAVGIPTIGLFGPTRDKIYSPFGENKTLAIRTKESYDELMSKIKSDPNLLSHSLMNSLKVEQVYKQLCTFYSE